MSSSRSSDSGESFVHHSHVFVLREDDGAGPGAVRPGARHADEFVVRERDPREPSDSPGWGFLTHHALVLLLLAQEPTIQLSDIAARLDVGERWVQQIVKELAAAGCVARRRLGRRFYHAVQLDARLGHDAERQWYVKDLLALFVR